MSTALLDLLTGFLACGILVLVFKFIHWMTKEENPKTSSKK